MRKCTELKNKIRVVTQQLKDRESVALGVWVGVGGRYENDQNKGIAHFLEHIVFKGSKKYGCEAIKQGIEGIGGGLNAFTSEEQTCYYAKVPNAYLNKAFDILSDMVFYPTIASIDVAKEKTVILEEIKMYHDLPQYYVMELLDGLIWPDHPVGKSLAGTAQSVSGLTREHLVDYRSEHYQPNRIVISAAGSVDHDRLVQLISKKLSSLKGECRKHYLGVQNRQAPSRVHLFKKDTEQMHLAVGSLGIETNHPDLYTLAILNIILGGNMSSRLFNEVREKRGLAYSISSGIKSLDDTGVFMIRAGVDNHKIVEAVELILKVLEKIAKNGVTDDELKRAKDYYTGQFQLALEDTQDYMLWIGETLISNDMVRTLEDVLKKIRQVTTVDIKRVARTILPLQKMNLAVVGPLNEAQNKSLKGLISD